MVTPVLKMRPHPAAHSHEPLMRKYPPPPPQVRFKQQVKDVDEALENAVESLEFCKSNITTMHPLNPRGGGVSWLGVCRPVIQILTYFRKMTFFTLVFRPVLQEIMS